MVSRSLPFKLLSLTLIVALLAMRLSSFSEQVFVEPVEDAIFDVAFIAAEDSPGNGKPIKVKTKRALDVVLFSAEEIVQHGCYPRMPATPMISTLVIKNILQEIFIPPETVS